MGLCLALLFDLSGMGLIIFGYCLGNSVVEITGGGLIVTGQVLLLFGMRKRKNLKNKEDATLQS